eukprot:scaffold21555_cov54-Attheya_sp.AAC.2
MDKTKRTYPWEQSQAREKIMNRPHDASTSIPSQPWPCKNNIHPPTMYQTARQPCSQKYQWQGWNFLQRRGPISGNEPRHHIFGTQQSSNTIHGLRTQCRWRKEEASGGIGEISTTSLEGVERGASDTITSTFSSHSNQPIGRTPIPIATTITSIAIPLTL